MKPLLSVLMTELQMTAMELLMFHLILSKKERFDVENMQTQLHLNSRVFWYYSLGGEELHILEINREPLDRLETIVYYKSKVTF